MPTSTIPDAGRVVFREARGTADAPVDGNSLFPGKLFHGPIGTWNPVTMSDGWPVQFDTATALRIGTPGDAAAADESSTAGMIALLKGALRELIEVSAALSGTLTASGSFTLSGGVDVETVPTVGETTREYALANSVLAAFTATSTAAATLPTLGASREVRLQATQPCWLVWGASGVGAASAAAGSILVGAYSAEVVRIPAGATHFRVIRAADDGSLLITAVA